MLDTYSKLLIVSVDNVGSNQLQSVRSSLRGRAELLMGKNTMMRLVVNEYVKKHPNHPYAKLIPELRGNVGLFFTNGDLAEVRKLIEANRVPAPAKVGSIAPKDVVIPPGPTDCDPGQTSFFQVLQVPTKIVKGRIEITAPVNLIKQGNKVGASEAALLSKLKISPFSYGITILTAYDNGSLFDVKVLDLTPEDLRKKFLAAVSNIASISLKLGYPTTASAPHSVANAYKNLVSITVLLENYSFPRAEPAKAFVKDPTAFAVAAPVVTTTASTTTAAPAKKEEEDEEEVVAGLGSLVGGGDY